LQILIPKYGLEGTLYLNPLSGDKKTTTTIFTFNEEDNTQRCGNVIFHAFDPVIVRLSLDSSNVQHEKLVFHLVKPYIKGFSIEDETETSSQTSQPPEKKLKKDKKQKNK